MRMDKRRQVWGSGHRKERPEGRCTSRVRRLLHLGRKDETETKPVRQSAKTAFNKDIGPIKYNYCPNLFPNCWYCIIVLVPTILFQCQNPRAYVKRVSRSSQLRDPNLRPVPKEQKPPELLDYERELEEIENEKKRMEKIQQKKLKRERR